MRLKLNECVRFIKYFTETVEQYTKSIWKQSRPWQGSEVDLESINIFIARVNEVLDLRNQYEELNNIILSNKGFKSDIHGTFSIFKGVNVLNASPFAQNSWNTCKNKFSSSMESIEDDIINFLKKEIFSSKSIENAV